MINISNKIKWHYITIFMILVVILYFLIRCIQAFDVTIAWFVYMSLISLCFVFVIIFMITRTFRTFSVVRKGKNVIFQLRIIGMIVSEKKIKIKKIESIDLYKVGILFSLKESKTIYFKHRLLTENQLSNLERIIVANNIDIRKHKNEIDNKLINKSEKLFGIFWEGS